MFKLTSMIIFRNYAVGEVFKAKGTCIIIIIILRMCAVSNTHWQDFFDMQSTTVLLMISDISDMNP